MIHTYVHAQKCSRCEGWFDFIVTDPAEPTSTTGFACPDCSVVLNEGMAQQQQTMLNVPWGGVGAARPGQGMYSEVGRVAALERIHNKLEDRVTNTALQTNERIDDLDDRVRLIERVGLLLKREDNL